VDVVDGQVLVRVGGRPQVPREIEGAALAACDVGLAPLTDDAWTRGKGGYRSIQYAAAGLPSVASPVGANCEVVTAGETGLFATTPREWHAALTTLGGDANLRRRLGAAARERARVYDRAVIVPRYADLILKLLQDESGSRS
jgi:glycosyltransferase involved in cell wall biosynthesis